MQDRGPLFYKLRSFAPSLFIGLILIFVLARAGSWSGIAQPSTTLPAMGLVGVMVMAWLMLRMRFVYQWHNTPLDLALPFWFLAFIISSASNLSMWDYILIGLWFVGLYILLWYITFDVLSNNLLNPERLLDGLFIAALPVLASAVYQNLTCDDGGRTTGLMQNANLLAAFLVLIIPLSAYRILNTRRAIRAGYIVFMVAAVIVLLMSQSRGGILGVCFSVGLVAFGHLPRRRERVALVIGSLILGAALVGLRGDAGRAGIYEQAAEVLSTRMLTGQGLFTFRTNEFARELLLAAPPNGQNLHAHNLWLHITVELGIVGLLALAVTMFQFARAVPHIGVQFWCLVSVFGLMAQQIVDFTVMTPSIALCTIMILGIANLSKTTAVSSTRRPVWLLGILAVVLLLTGLAVRHTPRFYL